MFASSTIVSLFVGGLLALIIPLAAAVIFKLKNRETWLPSVFIGAGTLLLFALILEQLLHAVMLPIVKDNAFLYSVYGAFAAGIFEETGRFAAYKTLMRKHYTTKNAVYMGIGHGGFEAMVIGGISFISYAVVALVVNAVGVEQFIQMSTAGNAELAEMLEPQLDSIAAMGVVSVVQALYERIVAMTFHVCMSVVVYKAVTQKGKIWLYPTAIALHAALDFFAALYQVKVIDSIAVLYVIFTIFAAAVVFGTVMLAKKLPDKAV